jgi:hypothetical protein
MARRRDGFGRHLDRRKRAVVLRTSRLDRHYFRDGENPSTKLVGQFQRHFKNKRVICLDIPDDYAFMDPVLVRTLESRVSRFLPRAKTAAREESGDAGP